MGLKRINKNFGLFVGFERVLMSDDTLVFFFLIQFQFLQAE